MHIYSTGVSTGIYKILPFKINEIVKKPFIHYPYSFSTEFHYKKKNQHFYTSWIPSTFAAI